MKSLLPIQEHLITVHDSALCILHENSPQIKATQAYYELSSGWTQFHSPVTGPLLTELCIHTKNLYPFRNKGSSGHAVNI